MAETFNEDQVMKIAKYIQKKERRIAALNIAIGMVNNPTYVKELGEMALVVYRDKMPGSLPLHEISPELYPEPKEEKKEEEEDPATG